MTIFKYVNTKYFKVTIINILVLMICLLASYNNLTKVSIYPIVLFIYYLFLFIQKRDNDIVLYQIIMFIISTFILDIIFHYFKISTPLELKYIVEGISIVLFLRILINRKVYTDILRDYFFITISIIIIFSLITSFFNGNKFIDLFNAIRIYFRYIPIYIVLSKEVLKLKSFYRVVYLFNLLVFIIQTILGVHRDLRVGIFGIVGASCFEIFIIIFYMNMLIKYLYKEVSFYKLFIVFLGTTAMFAIAESKSTLIMFILISILIICFINTKIFKKVIIFTVLIAMLISGWNMMIKLYPNFAYFADISKIGEFTKDYIFGNSNEVMFEKGRYEAAMFVSDMEKKDSIDKLFGVGLGKSIPPENLFYDTDANGRQVVWDFRQSQIFNKYGIRVGYHLSSFGIVLIDSGYIGIAILISFIIIFFKRGLYLLRKGETTEVKILGGMAIYIALSAIFHCGYANSLTDRSYLFIVCLLLGIIQNAYLNLKSKRLLK